MNHLPRVTFDMAYVNAQIAQHARALDVVDAVLLPGANHPQLRVVLVRDVRPALVRELTNARALQAELRRAP